VFSVATFLPFLSNSQVLLFSFPIITSDKYQLSRIKRQFCR
jgi:hypothetical protein